MKNHLENKFQNEFAEAARFYGCYVVANVQSAFQMGQPDIRIWSRAGYAMDIENKVHRTGDLSRENILKLLRPTQKAVILHQLWPRNAPCLVVAHLHNNPEFCMVLGKSSEMSMRWKSLACAISKVKTYENFIELTQERISDGN
jgi:hypothetical protein